MPIGSVVLTPGSAYLVVGPPTIDLRAEAPAQDQWTARVALGITERVDASMTPLLLVFTGEAAVHAPHVGFAQRSARRAVGGYVLVDPVLPKPGAVSDWPDAPVTVIVSPGASEEARSSALGARLRGWEVLEGDPAEIISAIAARP